MRSGAGLTFRTFRHTVYIYIQCIYAYICMRHKHKFFCCCYCRCLFCSKPASLHCIRLHFGKLLEAITGYLMLTDNSPGFGSNLIHNWKWRPRSIWYALFFLHQQHCVIFFFSPFPPHFSFSLLWCPLSMTIHTSVEIAPNFRFQPKCAFK